MLFLRFALGQNKWSESVYSVQRRGAGNFSGMASLFTERIISQMQAEGMPVARNQNGASGTFEDWLNLYSHVGGTTLGLAAVELEGRCKYSSPYFSDEHRDILACFSQSYNIPNQDIAFCRVLFLHPCRIHYQRCSKAHCALGQRGWGSTGCWPSSLRARPVLFRSAHRFFEASMIYPRAHGLPSVARCHH